MPAETVFPTQFPTKLALYVGIILGDILYGVEAYLYFQTMCTFLDGRRARRKSDIFYAVFSTVVFFLITIFWTCVWIVTQAGWLVDNPPKYIPFGYLDFLASVPVALQLLTDGLMMYRCRIVWDDLRAIIVPFILWLATLALGVAFIWIRSVTYTNPFEHGPAKITLAYYTISVSLAAILTCMICGRLMYHARIMKKCLGEDYAAPYSGVVVLLVECMLPFTLTGIVFLGSIVANSPAVFAILQVFTLMMCVSPQMLILQVARGRAWQEETTKTLHSAVMFAHSTQDTSCLDSLNRVGSIVYLESLPRSFPPTRESGGDGKV